MKTKSNVSADVLNRIRETASTDYANAVPIATPNCDNIRDIGAIIMDSPNLQNEFSNWLINRIGKVVLKTRMFENPLKPFNKGDLPYGSSVEEVFINLIKVNQYDAQTGETNVYKRELADVRSMFHVLNSELFYKTSVGRRELEKAFLSPEGVYDLVEFIVGKLVVSANYDQFLMMKFLLAKACVDGTLKLEPVAQVTDEASARGLMKAIKRTSNDFEILSTEYNTAHVYNSSSKDDQYLVISNKNDSELSVDCLSYMFNQQYAQSVEKIIRIDGFDKLDMPRLREILGLAKTDPDPITSDELTALGNVEAVLLDWSWFQIYYKLFETRYLENPENLYENTWLHVWMIYSRSIFENCVVFVSGSNGVSSVTIDSESVPSIVHGVGGSATIDASVSITGLTPQQGGRVIWSVTTGDGATGTATIDANGKLTWSDGFTATDTITVTCTSAVDSTKTDSETITVS